jgi:RNA-binding protein
MSDPKVPPRRPKDDLTGKQRSYLRGLAHHIQPVVQMGREGLSDGVVDAVAKALRDHELIKVRVMESSPDDRRAATPQLAARCGAHEVGQVGRVVILYRAHDTDPVIRLPRRAAPSPT